MRRTCRCLGLLLLAAALAAPLVTTGCAAQVSGSVTKKFAPSQQVNSNSQPPSTR